MPVMNTSVSGSWAKSSRTVASSVESERRRRVSAIGPLRPMNGPDVSRARTRACSEASAADPNVMAKTSRWAEKPEPPRSTSPRPLNRYDARAPARSTAVRACRSRSASPVTAVDPHPSVPPWRITLSLPTRARAVSAAARRPASDGARPSTTSSTSGICPVWSLITTRRCRGTRATLTRMPGSPVLLPALHVRPDCRYPAALSLARTSSKETEPSSRTTAADPTRSCPYTSHSMSAGDHPSTSCITSTFVVSTDRVARSRRPASFISAARSPRVSTASRPRCSRTCFQSVKPTIVVRAGSASSADVSAGLVSGRRAAAHQPPAIASAMTRIETTRRAGVRFP